MTFPRIPATTSFAKRLTAVLFSVAAAACNTAGDLTSPTAPSALAGAANATLNVTSSANLAPLAAGGGAKALVLLTGGFFTESQQRVSIVNDGSRKLELSADQSVFQDSINLANTIAAGTAPCATDPANVSAERKAGLLAKMADALQNRHFNAVVDKQKVGAASETHSVAHTWSEPDGLLLSLRIGVATELLPGASATVTETSRDVFVYTGGAARIADRTGKTPNHVYMACPNLDQVTVTLIR